MTKVFLFLRYCQPIEVLSSGLGLTQVRCQASKNTGTKRRQTRAGEPVVVDLAGVRAKSGQVGEIAVALQPARASLRQ